MKYYFSFLQILLLVSGINTLSACCWHSKNVEQQENDTKRITPLAMREISYSTDTNSSDERTSTQFDSFFSKKERTSFSIFTAYDGNLSSEVIAVTEQDLISRHQFSKDSAQCFVYLKGGFMNSFDYEDPLEETRDVRKHALKFLKERDFFPKDYPEESRCNLVYALQVVMQKRYALLNYCMNILLDRPTTTSEFFLDFSTKTNIEQHFSENLAHFVERNPTMKMSPALKEKLSKAGTWITILSAFGSYPIKRSCWRQFRQKLDYYF